MSDHEWVQVQVIDPETGEPKEVATKVEVVNDTLQWPCGDT